MFSGAFSEHENKKINLAKCLVFYFDFQHEEMSQMNWLSYLHPKYETIVINYCFKVFTLKMFSTNKYQIIMRLTITTLGFAQENNRALTKTILPLSELKD